MRGDVEASNKSKGRNVIMPQTLSLVSHSPFVRMLFLFVQMFGSFLSNSVKKYCFDWLSYGNKYII